MKIETYNQLAELPIGSELYKVENNDVQQYKIACVYPSEHLKSILIAYGTNHGCSKWIGESQVKTAKLFTKYDDAVALLLQEMQSDIDTVKRLYVKS